MLGFSAASARTMNDHGYLKIDCAMYCDVGTLRIYEKGAKRMDGPTYEDDDVLVIQRRGGDVWYLQNGKRLSMCGQKLQGKVLADVSTYKSNGGGILKAEWVGVKSVHSMQWDVAGHPVAWRSLVGTKADAKGGLAKHSGSVWNGGAVSTDSFDGDVVLQFKCALKQHTMVGFATFDCNGHHYRHIPCAFYCNNGALATYETGRNKGRIGKSGGGFYGYDQNSVLTVSRKKNGEVQFAKDGQKLRSCSVKMTKPVFAEVSIFHNSKSGLLEASWNPRKGAPPPPPPPTPTPTPTPPSPPTPSSQTTNLVRWRALSCIKSNQKTGALTKNACGNGWTGGAISSNVARGDVTLNYRCSKKMHAHIGFTKFTKGNADNHFRSIECAMYCNQGTLHTYEKGHETWPGFNGARYSDRSKLALRRRGTKIEHLQDGKVLKSCRYVAMHSVLVSVLVSFLS